MESLPNSMISAAEDETVEATDLPATAPRRSHASRDEGRIRVPARHKIFDVGDPADRLYCSSPASVVIFRPTSAGHKTIIDIVAPGRWFGFSNRHFHDCAAVSAAPTQLSAFGVGEVMAQPSSSKRAFEEAVHQIERLRKIATIRLGATTVERLAAFLAAQLPLVATAPTTVAMPLSRRDLADHLATTVETLARNMAAMGRAAVIGKQHRGDVEILDVDALRLLAIGATKLGADFLREREARAPQG